MRVKKVNIGGATPSPSSLKSSRILVGRSSSVDSVIHKSVSSSRSSTLSAHQTETEAPVKHILPTQPIELITSHPRLAPIGCMGSIPSPRSGHIAVCDLTGTNLYVFGGYHDQRCFNDLFAYNIPSRSWRKLKCTGRSPSERVSHQGVIDGNYLLIFGGSNVPFGHSNQNDFYICDLKRLHWEQIVSSGDVPCPRYGHSLVRRHNKLYLFGGTSGCIYFNDLYEFDLADRRWTRLDIALDPIPANAAGASASSYVRQDANTYGIPNQNSSNMPDSTHEPINTNASVGVQHSVSVRPTARYRHEAVADNDFMYVVGGGVPNPSRTPIEVYSYHFATGEWQLRTCKPDVCGLRKCAEEFPTARRSHSCVAYDGVIYMYGGTDGLNMFDDFWMLETKGFQWRRVLLSSMTNFAKCFHAADVTPQGAMYIFGGCADSNGNVRSNEISSVHFKLPSLFDLCRQAVGQCELFSRQLLLKAGLHSELVEQLRPNFLYSKQRNVDSARDVDQFITDEEMTLDEETDDDAMLS
eukprot:CFRG5828T1